MPEIKESIKQFIEAGRNPDKYSFSFHSDWDSFSLKPMNWRDFEFIDFSFIRFRVETNCYSRYFEFNFALLGFHFDFDFYR